MKNKVYPFVSKELVDKILEDPSVCQKIIEHEKLMTLKLNKIVMEFFCSKEFLNKVFEGVKKEDNNEKIRITWKNRTLGIKVGKGHKKY